MTVVSNNDIAHAVYLLAKDKNHSEQTKISKKVAEFLFRKKLLFLAEGILLQLKKIINQEENRIIVRVWSAEKLDQQTKTHLEQTLKKRHHAEEFVLLESLDEKLLGGLRLEVNDEVIDFSVKNKIKQLKEHLTKFA